MKAVHVNKYGGSEVLEVTEIVIPTPSDNQILVEIYAASINPFDVKLMSGIYKDMIPVNLPYIPGGDFSGVVSEVGKNVTDYKNGDEIYGTANILSGGSGSFAEYCLVSSENIFLKPTNTDFNSAAAIVLVGVSALQALEENIHLRTGNRILIHGGSGGIGHIAIQLAVALGADVATTVSGENVEFVKTLGVSEIIDYKIKDFEKILNNYDAVFDTVGGETTTKSFSVLRKGGVLVSMLGEPDQTKAKELGITAIVQNTKVNSERLQKLGRYMEDGKVKVNVDRIFPLTKVKEAFDFFLTNSGKKGKTVIEVK